METLRFYNQPPDKSFNPTLVFVHVYIDGELRLAQAWQSNRKPKTRVWVLIPVLEVVKPEDKEVPTLPS